MSDIEKVKENIRKILRDRDITQYIGAEYMGTTPSQMSKILNGDIQLSLKQLSNFATSLNMQIIDVITYPDKYVKLCNEQRNEPVEAVLQIKLQSDKKDQVLKLVFGDRDLEILSSQKDLLSHI